MRAAAWLVLVACAPGEAIDSTRSALIQDAAHGGHAGFFFLPPLVDATPLPPTYDGSLTLVGRLDGPDGFIASFPFVARRSQQLYRGHLETEGLELEPTKIYRVHVLSGGLELGFADIKVFKKKKKALSMASDQYFELVEGHLLKIEVYVNQCAVVTCTGSLAVSADVDEVEAGGAELGYQGPVAIAEATIHDDAPAALAPWWPATGTSSLAVTIAGSVGAWRPRSSRGACAPLELTEANGTGGQAFADLVQESRGLSGNELCVYSLEDTQFLEVRLVRTGPAQTPTLGGLGAAWHRFESRFSAELPEQVFDGQMLDLRLLDGMHGPLPLRGTLQVDAGQGAELVPWYHADLDGTATFGLTPTAD